MKKFYLLILWFAGINIVQGQDKMPEPLLGNDAFVKYINSHLKLNEKVLKKDLVGEILLEFRVNESGKLDSFNIVKDIGENAALDLIKVIKNSGDWIPANVNGVNKAAWIKLPYKIVPNDLSYMGIIEATPLDGTELFKKKFLNNFNYPSKAITAGLKGDYTLSFTVKKDGRLTNIKLLKDPGFDVAESAIRALKKSGDWRPAQKDGENVDSESSFTFTLKLKEFRKHI